MFHFKKFIPLQFYLACLILGLAPVCSAQQTAKQAKPQPENNQSGILYGDNFSYAISAPKGWIMDDKTARDVGLSVVFYRPGETWQNAKAAMYVNVIGRVKGLTAKEVIADDIATFKKHHPKMGVTQEEALQTRDKRNAITYVFSKVSEKASEERVAYVETPTVVLLIVLSAKTTQDYSDAVADHTALVKSIFYLPVKVETKKVETKKAETKKAETKKAETKKAETKKAK